MSEIGMSEVMEPPINPEKESGAVRRVAEKVGKFLSETYTKKGAIKKQMAQYEKIFNQFTGEQRAEMKDFYEKKANKSATFKVIRNWVVTGAGLALGYVGVVEPKLIGLALSGLGTAISNAGVGLKDAGLAVGGALGTGMQNSGEFMTRSIAGIKDWMFDLTGPKRVVATIDKTAFLAEAKRIGDMVVEPFGVVGDAWDSSKDLVSRAFTETWNGLKPAVDFFKNPNLPMPTIRVK